MSGKRIYTKEQIIFLERHITRLAYKELTASFNKTFTTNKSVGCIKAICALYGIKTGRNAQFTSVPVGSEVVNKLDYVIVKTDKKSSDGRPVWRGKHVLVWESVHGEIPKECKIIFADGNNRNFSIDNLVKVTSREFIYLNSNKLRFPDAELTKAAIGIAKLGVSIWGKEREQEKQPPASTR